MRLVDDVTDTLTVAQNLCHFSYVANPQSPEPAPLALEHQRQAVEDTVANGRSPHCYRCSDHMLNIEEETWLLLPIVRATSSETLICGQRIVSHGRHIDVFAGSFRSATRLLMRPGRTLVLFRASD